MKDTAKTYHGYRFPIEIIGYGVWLYHRFTLSFRGVEELLAERGVTRPSANGAVSSALNMPGGSDDGNAS